MLSVLKQFLLRLLRKKIALLNRLASLIDKKDRVPSYREALAAFLEKNLLSPSGEILDLGSGQWAWTKNRLSDVSGCHIVSFDRTKTENVDIAGDLLKLDDYFKPGYFDLIICTDVMEHVSHPFTAMEKISAVLKSGGAILLSCPFDKELHGENYGDYWRITRQGWQELLKEYFKNIEISYLGEELKPRAYFIKAVKK
ncbi:MAG: methyltransferase domain-containing protein [Patescibacteria group bacterium]|nr:methyltransferase domain-containing protein [Patescibacteria group bacterium]